MFMRFIKIAALTFFLAPLSLRAAEHPEQPKKQESKEHPAEHPKQGEGKAVSTADISAGIKNISRPKPKRPAIGNFT